MDRDSTGTLWATFTLGSNVMISHTQGGNDASWTTATKLPAQAEPIATQTDSSNQQYADDISAIVAYDGNKVGVMWSNTVDSVMRMYWASHVDGTPDTEWTAIRWPALMIATRSQRRSTSDNTCELKKTVRPSPRRSSRIL